MFDDPDATNNTDTVALAPVQRTADLSVSTSVSAGAGLDGQVPTLSGHTVRVTVANDGPHGAEVSVDLAYPLTVVAPISQPAGCDAVALTCSLGLPTGVTRTLDVEFGPRTNLVVNPLQYAATVSSSNATDDDQSNNTSTLEVSFRPRTADVAVTEIVALSNDGEVLTGDSGSYEVRFENLGPDDPHKPVLEVRYQDAAPSPLPFGCSALVVTAPFDGGLTCELLALGAGSSGQLYLDLEFFGPNPDPSVLEATIVDTDDTEPSNNAAQVSTLVLADGDGDGIADRDDIFTGAAVTAGESIDINAIEFGPLEPIKLFLFSEPVLLAEGAAGADGVVSLQVMIPEDTAPGEHTLELRGDSGRTLSTPVTVLPAPDSEACTITGTDGRDWLVGTPGDDIICAGAGDGLVIGRGGNDVIIGGPGRDILFGGTGNDVLIGGPGIDLLLGGAGRDTVCWAGDCR